MKVILVRHCETDRNRDGRVQGQSDAPLTLRGIMQAEAIARSLRGQTVQAVYSSPLCRATQTAAPIAAAFGLEVQPEPAMTEIDAGDMDGLTGVEMRERFPDFMAAWHAGPDGNVPMPGGESLNSVQERAWAFLESLPDREGLEQAVCVTHNFVLLAILARAVHLPLSNIRRVRQSVGCISTIDFRNQRVQISQLNETCHLKGI